MPRLINPTRLIGCRFHKLVVKECLEPSRGLSNQGGRYRCSCDCGNTKDVDGYRLSLHRAPHSCGCRTRKEIGEKSTQRKRLYDKATVNHEYASHRTRALKKDRGCLSRQEWESVVFSPCAYCGGFDTRSVMRNRLGLMTRQYLTPISDAEMDKYSVNMNGVDRLDSSLGYIASNCVPCCGRCNKMKLDSSLEVFLGHIAKIHRYRCVSSPVTPAGT